MLPQQKKQQFPILPLQLKTIRNTPNCVPATVDKPALTPPRIEFAMMIVTDGPGTMTNKKLAIATVINVDRETINNPVSE